MKWETVAKEFPSPFPINGRACRLTLKLLLKARKRKRHFHAATISKSTNPNSGSLQSLFKMGCFATKISHRAMPLSQAGMAISTGKLEGPSDGWDKERRPSLDADDLPSTSQMLPCFFL